MPMNEENLQLEIEEILNEEFNVYEMHSRMTVLTNAVARAVVSHIKRNAKTVVEHGSSSGHHRII